MKSWFLRILYYAVPTLALVAIVLIMNSGSVFKRPLTAEDNLPVRLQRVSDLALSSRWDEANHAGIELTHTWERIKGRLRFTSTTDEIEIFDLLLAELQAAVEGQDQTLVRSAHRRLEALWLDLGS